MIVDVASGRLRPQLSEVRLLAHILDVVDDAEDQHDDPEREQRFAELALRAPLPETTSCSRCCRKNWKIAKPKLMSDREGCG